jgi:hypothetical protein
MQAASPVGLAGQVGDSAGADISRESINPCASQELVPFFKSRGATRPPISKRQLPLGSIASNQEEDAMYKSLVTIAATLAILSVGSLMSDPAQAGASASAPRNTAKRAPPDINVDGLAHPPFQWHLGILFEQ